jgi:hypothetical protein
MPEEIAPEAPVGGEPLAPIQQPIRVPSGSNSTWKTVLVLCGGPLLQIAAQFFSNYLTTRGYLNVDVARAFLLVSGVAISLLIIICVMAFSIRPRWMTIGVGICIVVIISIGLEKWAPPKSPSDRSLDLRTNVSPAPGPKMRTATEIEDIVRRAMGTTSNQPTSKTNKNGTEQRTSSKTYFQRLPVIHSNTQATYPGANERLSTLSYTCWI